MSPVRRSPLTSYGKQILVTEARKKNSEMALPVKSMSKMSYNKTEPKDGESGTVRAKHGSISTAP